MWARQVGGGGRDKPKVVHGEGVEVRGVNVICEGTGMGKE